MTKERVSSIDSLLGSSENSMASSVMEEDDLKLLKSLTMAGLGVETKGCGTMGVKHGKSKKMSPTKIIGTLKGIHSKGQDLDVALWTDWPGWQERAQRHII